MALNTSKSRFARILHIKNGGDNMLFETIKKADDDDDDDDNDDDNDDYIG